MIHFFHKKNKILVSTNLKVMYSSLSHTDSLVEIKYKKFLFLKIINIFKVNSIIYLLEILIRVLLLLFLFIKINFILHQSELLIAIEILSVSEF